jgi:hypothetical protein
MTAAEAFKFYKYISDLNDNTFGKSDDHWRIWINNTGDNDGHKLSFSLYHYFFEKDGDNFKEVKRYDISLDEPLIVFLKAIEECKRIVQKYIIDNL